jgi:hypothetical protein
MRHAASRARAPRFAAVGARLRLDEQQRRRLPNPHG